MFARTPIFPGLRQIFIFRRDGTGAPVDFVIPVGHKPANAVQARVCFRNRRRDQPPEVDVEVFAMLMFLVGFYDSTESRDKPILLDWM